MPTVSSSAARSHPGGLYIRELKAVARLNGQAGEDEGPGVNDQGHRLSADTVRVLSDWTLHSVAVRPADDVLLVDRADRRADSTIGDHLTMLGSRVEHRIVDGTAEMLLPPHLSTVPEDLLGGIVEWLDAWRAPAEIAAPTGRDEFASSLAGPASPASIERFNERPIQFGPDNRLFGLLTRPRTPRRRSPRPSSFSGPAPGTTSGRIAFWYVPLAREWASRGHFVLRFDLGGIGDSLPADERDAGDPYPPRMLYDLRDAIALARRAAPGNRIVLAGLCSGAGSPSTPPAAVFRHRCDCPAYLIRRSICATAAASGWVSSAVATDTSDRRATR